MKKTQVESDTDEAGQKLATEDAYQKLMSGDFQGALDACQLAYKKYPKNSEILKSYVEAIESINVQGNKAFNSGDFAQAQIFYDLLLKNSLRFSGFADLLSFEENFLVARLNVSRMLQAGKEARLAERIRMNQMLEAEKEAKLKMNRILQAEKEAQSFLKSGDFQKGIDIYKTLTQQYPSDATVYNRYVSLLESIKGRADIDLKRKDFALAGKTYRILLENYSTLNNLQQSLSYDAGLLDAGIKTCRKILFEDGLKHYRSGNLSQAVSIWKNILTFDPEDQDVKKATDMATLQSQNLGKIK